MSVFASIASPSQKAKTVKLPAPTILGSGVFIVAMVIFALLGPIVADPTLINPDIPTLAPFIDSAHWFGTDDLGRDILSRLAVGARISLLIGLATAVVSVIIGTLYGMVSAYLGGKTDTLMMRLVDIIYSLPGLMIVILFSVFLGRGVLSLVLALSLFSWPDTARMIRGQLLSLQKEEFIEAYHSIGGKPARLFLRHFLPNLMGLIVLTATITVPRAILTESTLSFIGLGVEPPLSSWGTLASEGWQLVRVAPHMLIWPGLFIFLTMVALNMLGDGLRLKLDPKAR